MNWSIVYRKENVDIIKSIVEMDHSILSTILASGLVPPPTITTPWMHRNSNVSMASDPHAGG